MTEDTKAQTLIQGPRIDLLLGVTINRDRFRCYKCRDFNHFANEHPNSVMDDSDSYESDRATLQLITTDAEIQQYSEEIRPIEEQDHLNL